MSPYVRKGLCVYHQNPDGSAGEKVGCSKTVAGAKKYLKAKYAHMPSQEKKLRQVNDALRGKRK